MTDKKMARFFSDQVLRKKNIDNKANAAKKTFNQLLCVFRWKAFIALSPIVVLLSWKSVKWIAVCSGNNGADFTCKYDVVYHYFVFVNTIRLFAAHIKYTRNISLFTGKLRSIADGNVKTSGPTSSQYRQGIFSLNTPRKVLVLSTESSEPAPSWRWRRSPQPAAAWQVTNTKLSVNLYEINITDWWRDRLSADVYSFLRVIFLGSASNESAQERARNARLRVLQIPCCSLILSLSKSTNSGQNRERRSSWIHSLV